ncbi:hypothetical protein F7725_001205 [Dissostichus mawsoni]|uniref:C-type lectin domain-containing protein n=1 Tax=Dissostichus mawsoni TaxID=36200 RepID=A0A7J5ZH24_DISMA|nr:hypothetical protein F7725_001205 [Dissostichus mawsoni]
MDGLHDDRDTWKWSMSDPSFYGPGETEFRRWGGDQPDYAHNEQCTYFDFIGITWQNYDCNTRLYVVCFDVTAVPVSMQVIKVRVEKPNGVDLNDQAFLDDMLVEMSELKINHLFLLDDNEFLCLRRKRTKGPGIGRQRQLAWRKQPDGQVDELCPESYRVNSPDQIRLLAIADNFQPWIGLYDDRLNSWKWSLSDPSFYGPGETEFRKWGGGQPDSTVIEQCSVIHPDDGTMWDRDCSETNFGVCCDVKDVPVSMQVIKVRVKKPDGVDLNDKAFLDDILVEAKKNLRAQGLDDNVQLVWRKQPDGQVFQKEEEKKRDDL